MNPGDGESDEIDTVFRDVITLALSGLMAALILVLPHIAPRTPPTAGEVDSPGALLVEARWADGLDADVDLWVQAPGDAPVGYSNKAGRVFNLLRDDLGNAMDPTSLNMELAVARATPPGQWAVNVHAYRGSYPVTVEVVISARKDGQLVPLHVARVTLERRGQELTVARWTTVAGGAVVPGSLHDLPISLRSARR